MKAGRTTAPLLKDIHRNASDRRELARLDFLGTFRESSRETLIRQTRFLTGAKGQVLIQKGDAVDGVILVLRGVLRVFALHSSGKEATLYRLSGGQMCFLSLNCTFSKSRFPAWAGVESKTAKAALLPGNMVREIFQTDPAVQNLVMRHLTAKVADLLLRLDESLLSSLPERLWGFLAASADAEGRVQVTHGELAAHLGSSREVVSREIRKMRERGLLSGSRSLISLARGASRKFSHNI